MHRRVAALVAAVGLLALFVVGVLWFIPAMEDDLTERAEAELAARGSSETAIEFDGRNGQLSGPGSAGAAEELDGDVRGARWVRAETDGNDAAASRTALTIATTSSTTMAPPEATTTSTPVVESSQPESPALTATRAEDTIVLNGTVGSEDDRQLLVGEVLSKGFRVDDRLVVDSNVSAGPDGPIPAVTPVLGAVLSGAEESSFEIADGTVRVSATADDVVEAELMEAAVAEAKNDGVAVEADISVVELSEDEQVVALESEIDQIFELARQIQIESPNFGTSQDELSEGATSILDRVSVAVRRYPLPIVEVIGHADNRGSAAVNQDLSVARATTALVYMTANGVAEDRLIASGRGETEPAATNATAEGRLENRRVNFAVRKRDS